ncbi:hypothetical protein RFI_29780, partial [Reticulomyxa filosa]
MISNENDVNDEEREFLKNAKFVLLCWKEDMSKLQQLSAWIMVNIFSSKTKLPSNEAIIEEKKKRIKVLCRAVGVPEAKKDAITKKLCEGEFEHYVLTYDNILKMAAILFNIRSNLPTVLMGETGCGKTALIRYLACATDTELEAVDIHGEKCKERLRPMESTVESKENEFQRNPKEIWLFLDEFNTSPDIGWFNELICNRSLDGVKIPDEIKILAACNPYRKRKLSEQEKEWFSRDQLAQYAYRVLPLCETVKVHLWQFGSLSELDERQYIFEMIKNRKKELKKSLQIMFDNEVSGIVKQICKSQTFLRTKLQDVAM